MALNPTSRNDPDALIESLSELVTQGSPTGTLDTAARLLADLARAPLSVVFLIRGDTVLAEHWHPADAGLKERFDSPLRLAALAAVDRPITHNGLSHAPCGTPFRLAARRADDDLVVVSALAWPQTSAPQPPLGPGVDRCLELAAARIATLERDARSLAKSEGYERWFRTLDQQLRLLDRERQKFSAVVSQSDTYVFVSDPSGTIRWTNKAMAQLDVQGGNDTVWLDRNCHEVCVRLGESVHHDDGARCPVFQVLEANQGVHRELRSSGPSGPRTLYLTALPIRGPDGHPHEVIVMVQDLTDLRVLRKSESRYRTLFERSASALVMVDPQTHRVLLANAVTSRMLGYARDRLLELSLRDLLVAEDWPRLEPVLERTRSGEIRDGLQCRLLGRDGSERIATVWPSRFDLEGDEVVMLELLDITARKQAEAALTEREDQLRQAQKLEAVGRLAGGIAHGFNNLLAVIMGRSEMLRDCLAPDDPRRRDVEQIHGASIQGAWLTRQLLTFSRKQVATPETVDLRAVVREMEEMLRCVLSEEVELVVAPGGRPANVHIDRPQIEQVLLNLVINARDAMPRGGVITVELTHIERPDRATRDASPLGPGRYVQLAVRDDGTGMDESTRSRLFEPFFTTKGADHGSGLGLSIVYGTITQAGGHVEVASEVGLGTTFKIFLPRQDGMPAKTNLPAADAVTGGDETILVVEDDDSVRAVTHEALAIEGYTVLTASGGREALDLVERHRGPLHMLVTDVVMPQMGGGELAQRLTAVRPDLRVLYVSGYADDAIVRQGVAESGAPFLQKPFSLESLALKVREVLDARLGAARDASSEPRRRNG